MARLFDEHVKRQVKILDGAWKFCTDPADEGMGAGWYLGNINGETVSVPSVWNNQKELLRYEGAAWYEKSFYTEGGALRFCFGAVLTEADVWLDGRYLGNHYGGFCQFEFMVPEVAEGWHRLTVRADNRFDAHSIPQAQVDWYHYGGIIRSVTVETLKGICITHSRFDYELSDDLSEAKCSLVLRLYNAKNSEISTTLKAAVGDREVYQGQVRLNGGEETELTLPSFIFDQIRLWDVFEPNLYMVSMFTDTDDLRERIGFRKIEVQDQKILLNRHEIEIMGVNRHDEYPEFGFAFPQSLMKRDLDMIVNMGCNFIRGSHYPNSRDFLDFLDERGILFWSEIPIWGCGFSEEALADPVVVSRGLEMHREMVKYYNNHPSIIMWGMHNEILTSTRAGYEMSKCYYEYLKKNGGPRLVVYASHVPMKDICMEFTDVICLNLYHGWYQGGLETWKVELDRFDARRKELGFETKPIIMSEFGAAAIYGWHDDEDIRWSEEYQAKLITYCLNLFHEYPAIAGSVIWQFCDIRTASEAGISRARGFNNKGLVNEYRKPKQAYFAAKKWFRQFAEEREKYLLIPTSFDKKLIKTNKAKKVIDKTL